MSAARRIVVRRSTTGSGRAFRWSGTAPRYGVACCAAPARSRTPSRDELIFLSAGQREDALLLERADDADDLGLRLLDRAGAHRAEQLDLLVEVLGGTLGEVPDHLVADVGPDTLERRGEVVGLHLAQHLLQGPVVDGDDVLEDEHLRTDLLGELGIGVVQPLEDGALGGPRRAVDDLDEGLDAADR